MYWKFQLLNSLAEAVPKLFVQKLAFWSKHFWTQPLPLEFLAENSLQSAYHILNFGYFPLNSDSTQYIYPLYNTHCFLEDELFFIFKSINTIIKLKLIIVIKIPDSNPYVPKEKNL